jgi:hypothetical protein
VAEATLTDVQEVMRHKRISVDEIFIKCFIVLFF